MSATDGSSSSQPTRKAYTGRVSKLLDNFGFIDDEVFFQLSVVRGGCVKLNDQVYVECHYSDHLPFKWNAQSVQVLDSNAAAAVATFQPAPSLKQPDSRPDPRQDPRNVPTAPAYFRPDHSADLPPSQQQLFQQPQSSGAAAPQNTSRAAFVSEYSPASDSNGLHGMHRNRQPQQQPAGPVFDSGPAASAFSRNNNSITYTSTPGSAFVSTQIQPVFSLDPALVAQPVAGSNPLSHAVGGGVRGFAAGSNAVPVATSTGPSRSSRWEPRAAAGGSNNAGGGSRNNSDATGNKSENRRRDRDSDRTAGGKDRFGRDRSLYGEGTTARSDRSRDRIRPNRVDRSTESPVSTTGSLSNAGRSENLPKGEVLKRQILSHDIRFRYGAKIHVPSDFEVLLVNQGFELNIQAIPKPVRFKNAGSRRDSKPRDRKSDAKEQSSKTSDVKRDTDSQSESQPKGSRKDKANVKEEIKEEVKEEVKEEFKEDEATDKSPETVEMDSAAGAEAKQDCVVKEEAADETVQDEEASQAADIDKSVEKEQKQPAADEKKKKGPKYGVKVILLSLPTMNHIFEQVFGYDFDHKSSSGYSYPLNKQISFLTFRNQNDGYSLLGGKFSPELDGFMPGSEKPNLIRTAIRCIKEQANIDLSPCSRWVSLGSFLYNRNDTFGQDSSYEYSTVFLPDVWSLLEKPVIQPVAVNGVVEPAVGVVPESEALVASLQPHESGNISGESGEELTKQPIHSPGTEAQFDQLFAPEEQAAPEAQTAKRELLDRINDLKVTDLKAELDSREVKFARNAKKAELLKLLTEALEKEVADEQPVQPPAAQEERIGGEEDVILEETAPEAADEPVSVGEKRKSDDSETSEEPAAKKLLSEEVTSSRATGSGKEGDNEKKAVPAAIEYKGDLSFSVLSLHQALSHHKNDHFELSVSAELLREALLKHFAVIIASCLKANPAVVAVPVAEVDRRKAKAPTYTQLAFSYIDDRQLGYIASDDVLQLLSLTGYRISKRVWQSLLSGIDKIHYKALEAPDVLIHPSPLQDPLMSDKVVASDSPSTVFVKDGVIYDVENLVDQREKYTKTQVELNEMRHAISEKEKLLSEFETRQKKMTSAIEKQNDEICGIKREKDGLRIKNEELRKVIDSALSSLNQGMKLIKDEPKV